MVVSVGVSDVYAPFGPVPKFAVRRDGGKLVGRFEDHDPFNGGDGGKTETCQMPGIWNMPAVVLTSLGILRKAAVVDVCWRVLSCYPVQPFAELGLDSTRPTWGSGI